MGSIQYAGVHLKTPLFVVMGHEGCGAVQAALAARNDGAREPSRIALLLDWIVPGLAAVDASAPADRADGSPAVEANVRWSMHRAARHARRAGPMAEGVLKLVGAVYELETGRVRFLA